MSGGGGGAAPPHPIIAPAPPTSKLPAINSIQAGFKRNYLHMAVMTDEPDYLEAALRLATPEEINARDCLGCTPAVLAAFIFGADDEEEQYALNALIKAGADLTIADNEGRDVAYWKRDYANEKKAAGEKAKNTP